jgi:hypothetical protein
MRRSPMCRALAERTREAFYPKESVQHAEVKGSGRRLIQELAVTGSITPRTSVTLLAGKPLSRACS